MVQNITDITDWELAMHIGESAREFGIQCVAGWIRSERKRLHEELGRDPHNKEIAHAIRNVHYSTKFRISPPEPTYFEAKESTI